MHMKRIYPTPPVYKLECRQLLPPPPRLMRPHEAVHLHIISSCGGTKGEFTVDDQVKFVATYCLLKVCILLSIYVLIHLVFPKMEIPFGCVYAISVSNDVCCYTLCLSSPVPPAILCSLVWS